VKIDTGKGTKRLVEKKTCKKKKVGLKKGMRKRRKPLGGEGVKEEGAEFSDRRKKEQERYDLAGRG